ncbi:MAG: septal ring lytic transglycosylase RlpA family protein, partial [Burkholderiales bacterium]|nr:septal ring lytic transglycosylase RlpA family protein [Burkholderiales bacterium]
MWISSDSCQAGRRASSWALAVIVAAAALAGCASGPGGGAKSGASRGAAPVRVWPSPDRDGAPASPPSDLAQTPDPEPQVEPIRSGGPNKPYVVLGQAYEPLSGDVVWKERGVASWYGTKFHGRKTASGELFSMYGLTAAHRTLPIPSYARVRNLGNGKEIIVRVNDRG